MKRILEKPIDFSHYVADVCAIWCFDDRFSDLLDSSVKKENIKKIDLVKVAGGAKGLASPTENCEKAFICDQVTKSIELHNPKMIWLMVHADCGAYGKNFFNSIEEGEFYLAELNKAEKVLVGFLEGERRSGIRIIKYYAGRDGLYEL